MITLIMAYYENGGMLDIHLREWAKYQDKDKWKIILVDDCSQQDPALPHIVDVGIDLELYRVKKDIPWNWDGARNLAMKHASGICLMTDMDHLLKAENAARVQSLKIKPNKHYRFSRELASGEWCKKPHPNSWLLHHDLFWSVNGYDERFHGYYGKDAFFRRDLQKVSSGEVMMDIPLTLYGREVQPDASTTQYGRKKSQYYLRNLPQKGEELPPVPVINFEWERVL